MFAKLKYFRQFGGDPNHVVIGGGSAGAASVTIHLTAYGGTFGGVGENSNNPLFHASIAQSQSFATVRTIEGSQYQYDGLAKRTGCDNDHSLGCLRKLSTADLQKHNIKQPYPEAKADPVFMYNPVVDKDFIQDVTIKLYQEGKYVKIPTIFG